MSFDASSDNSDRHFARSLRAMERAAARALASVVKAVELGEVSPDVHRCLVAMKWDVDDAIRLAHREWGDPDGQGILPAVEPFMLRRSPLDRD